MKVENKVMVVTGGGSGIGQQVALLLLERGATVAAVDINSEALNETKTIAGVLGGKLSLHQCDISNKDYVAQLAADVIARHGCVDGIINNAGIIHRFEPVSVLDDAVIDRMMNVNFYGTLNLIKALLPMLLQRPVAHITNVSSMGGLFAFPNQTFYGASKAAVKLLSEGLFVELKGSNVGVSVVFPGATNTKITYNCNAHNDRLEKLMKIYRGTPAKTVARCIVDGVENNKFRIVVGMDAHFFSFLYRLFPTLGLTLVSKIMSLAMPNK